jgi:SAM-dependent methyltransferase
MPHFTQLFPLLSLHITSIQALSLQHLTSCVAFQWINMETPFLDNPSILPWENHAASWDEQMGDNRNDYFSALKLPVLKRLISPQPGNRVLDLATGNGLVARWLAQEGALVFATDGSRAMIERARARTLTWCQQGRLSENRVSFHVLDVTDKSSWEQFISSTCQTVSRCH